MEQLCNPEPNLHRLLDRLDCLPGQQVTGTSVLSRQPQRRLEVQAVEALTADYRAGATVRQLSERYRIDRVTVMRHLKREGVRTRQSARTLTDEQLAEASWRYEAGASLASVAASLGINPQTLNNKLRAAGVIIRPRRGWPSITSSSSSSLTEPDRQPQQTRK